MERTVLASIALATIVFAGWRPVRAGHAALSVLGCGLAALGVIVAVALPSEPALACLALHVVVMLVTKSLWLGRAAPGSVPFVRGVAFLLLSGDPDPRRALVPDSSVDRRGGLRDGFAGAAEILAAPAACMAGERLGALTAGPWSAAWVRALALGLLLDGFMRSSTGFIRASGRRASPMFDRPWLARDLTEFWGGRWNQFVGRTLFHEVYRPWARRVGPWVASLFAFTASGAFHEVIWVLPTGVDTGRYMAFFGLQWCGTAVSSRLPPGGLRRAWLWAVLAATTPLFCGEAVAIGMPLERLAR